MHDADRSLPLPAEPASAALARRHVRRVLAGAVAEDVVTDAEVCASELVTNAVLHAGGTVVLTVHAPGDAAGDAAGDGPGPVRLEVADPSPVAPQWVPRSLTATTGRGLPLITALSVARGTEVHPAGGGKTVWCELSTAAARPGGAGPTPDADSLLAAEWASIADELAGEPTSGSTGPGPAAPAPGAGAGAPPVRLLRFPLRRGVRLREHREAVLRELRLLGMAHAFTDPGTERLAGDVTDLLTAEYGGHLNPAEVRKMAALAAGLECVDLEYARRPDHLALLERWIERMAEVDRLGRAGALLTAVEPPDVAELARWIVGEFGRQLRGGEPRPWEGSLD
ncbi:ATP-binding protein [Kineococcus sp. SYSU DK005]|uniref:ATP-binding protein n=1 Tax=Kineococcus sp. SYSU DK005 TaxID=3383126 RepID=UPI003D7D8E18